MISNFDIFYHLICRSYWYFLQIFNEHALFRRLSQLKFTFIVKIKQISELFVVEFDIRAHDKIVFVGIWSCCLQNRLKTSRNQSFLVLILWYSHHRMRFSWTSLTISEDSSIITLQNLFCKSSAGIFKHLFLVSLLRKDVIETERSVLVTLLIYIS